MAYTEALKRAVDKYKKENYDYIKLRLNKGEKDILKSRADAEGKSVNQYIRDKIF